MRINKIRTDCGASVEINKATGAVEVCLSVCLFFYLSFCPSGHLVHARHASRRHTLLRGMAVMGMFSILVWLWLLLFVSPAIMNPPIGLEVPEPLDETSCTTDTDCEEKFPDGHQTVIVEVQS